MIKRRHFLSGLLTAGASTLLAHTATVGVNPNILTPKPTATLPVKKRFPKKLKPGATIGLAAPGFAVSEKKLNQIVLFLEQQGYNVFQTGRIGQYGYFSNTDKNRATDLNELFANPSVDAILCVRGGYGCTRILDLLDYNTIKKHPKIILGFSDITALLQAIKAKTGLIGFHGPVGTTIENKYAKSCIKALLIIPKTQTTITPVPLIGSEYELNREYERYTIHNGIAKGPLVGGSLTLINALIGTPYEIDFTNTIVCIEDVEEKPYRIDRMLTQLLSSKTFKKASGIAFGVCAGCDTPKTPNNFTLKEVVENRIKDLNIPAAYGLSFGHVPDNCTLPIGANAIFNANTLEITITEQVVV